MLKIISILFCLIYCLNEISAKHLFRRSSDQFVCPEPNGMYSHRECTKFWKCFNSIPSEMDCPLDLWWDNGKQRCEWPENVVDSDCLKPTEPTSATEGPTTEQSTTTDAETTTGVTETETTTETETEGTTEDSDTETTTQAIEEGTNTQTGTEPDTTTIESTATNGTTQTKTDSTTEQTTTSSNTTKPSVKPPICEPGKVQYFPREDCDKFWKCEKGVAVEKECPTLSAWAGPISCCTMLAWVQCFFP